MFEKRTIHGVGTTPQVVSNACSGGEYRVTRRGGVTRAVSVRIYVVVRIELPQTPPK